jgi:hypothetical protein
MRVFSLLPGVTSNDSVEFMFAGVDGHIQPKNMDDMSQGSSPLSPSAATALDRLLSAEDANENGASRMRMQALQAQPWIGSRAAAVPNASIYRRELTASSISVSLTSLRSNNFEAGHLAAMDAAFYALDDGLESDWALDGDHRAAAGFRNSPSDVELFGAAAAVAAAVSAAAALCSSARGDMDSVTSLAAVAKRMLCPNPQLSNAMKYSTTAAAFTAVSCDRVQDSIFRLVQMIFHSRDPHQRCEASFATSLLLRHITRIPVPLPPKRPKVALLACATGGYKQFISPMTASARRHFLFSCCDLKFVIFTDNTQHESFQHDDIVALPRNHGGWPDASLGRTASYLAHAQQYAWADYVFATDIDVKFTRAIGSEILGRTVGTLHADNAFYRGDERTGHSTVNRLARKLFLLLTLHRWQVQLINPQRV